MSYRFENAVSGKAKCKATTCDHAAIAKGELRMGTWVTLSGTDKGSWAWRHWGCVTARQLANVKNKITEEGKINWDFCDGLGELTPEDQARVRAAVERGFVEDADWKGEAGKNRPAAAGGKKKAEATSDDEAEEEKPKKKSRAKKAARKDVPETEDENADKVPDKARDGGKNVAAPEADVEAAEPPAKKGRGRPKKIVAAEEDAGNAEVAETTVKRTRGRPKKVAAEDGKEKPVKAATAPTRASARTHGTKVPSYAEKQESDSEELTESAPKKKNIVARRGRKVTKETGNVAANEDIEAIKSANEGQKGEKEQDEPPTKDAPSGDTSKAGAKRGRKAKVDKTQDHVDKETSEEVKSVPTARGRKAKPITADTEADAPAEEQEEVQSARKPRGRKATVSSKTGEASSHKRKAADPDDTIEEKSEKEEAPKKKRGRPAKKSADK